MPLNNYQDRQVRFYASVAAAVLLTVFIGGNIITAIVKKSVKAERNSYVLKEGYPIFTDHAAYIKLIKNYPHDAGVNLSIYKIRYSESFWDVCKRHQITLDTFIAANPYLKSLAASEGTEVVIPEKDGVLFAFDQFTDVFRMSRKLEYRNNISGKYLPTFFKIISTDDIRFVFFQNSRPRIVNDSLEKLNNYRNIFQAPLVGFITSAYGDRVDPFFHENMEFHNGIDIMNRQGTPVRPAREGIVTYSGWRDGYGLCVTMQHHDGFSTLYGHFSLIKVKTGDWLKNDDILGLVGSTGRSTGPHLHFIIMRHGEIINPLLFIW